MKTSNGEGYSERELLEKAIKYDILINSITNTLEYSRWANDVDIYGSQQIIQTLKSLEPFLMEHALQTLREKWQKENPEEE